MRVSYEWLTELAGVADMTPEHAAQLLTMVGFTVDTIERVDLSQILIGRFLRFNATVAKYGDSHD